MSHRTTPRKHVLALSIAALFASGASAQTTADTEPTAAATVVVTGTRVSNRTVLDTASPVDVISADTLKNAGTTEINQALSVALPSLNFPRPSLADGFDTIRPATATWPASTNSAPPATRSCSPASRPTLFHHLRKHHECTSRLHALLRARLQMGVVAISERQGQPCTKTTAASLPG